MEYRSAGRFFVVYQPMLGERVALPDGFVAIHISLLPFMKLECEQPLLGDQRVALNPQDVVADKDAGVFFQNDD